MTKAFLEITLDSRLSSSKPRDLKEGNVQTQEARPEIVRNTQNNMKWTISTFPK